MQELKPVVAGSRGGYGWKQWTATRRRQYEAWCKEHDLNPADDESNYGFLVWEGLNSEKKAIAGLKKTTTLEAATETYMLLDLRPGAPHLAGRISWAKKAWAAMEKAPEKEPEKKVVVVTKPPVVEKPVVVIKPSVTKPAEPKVEDGALAGGVLAAIITAMQENWLWAVGISAGILAIWITVKLIRKAKNG
jgi:hypothetical protein